MSDFLPLDELPSATDTARRDGWGRYLCVHPQSGQLTGYTRVTTVAKTLESMGGLAPWKATMTASGIIMRPGLRAQWEALIAREGDPWYANEEAKTACKRLVEECSAVGGANDRKEIGSSLHTITAMVDMGQTPSHLTEETERDVKAYLEGRKRAGIEIPAGQVELMVVLDDYQVAGTLDRLAVVPGFPLPMVADLKTGAQLSYSWQSIAVQLAGYSRANAIYKQGPASDGSQDQRLPMPEVDQNSGLIFWLNAGTGELELYVVDLALGWEAFQHSLWARNWRRSHPAMRLDRYQAATPPQNLEKTLQASIEKVEEQKIEQPEENERDDKFWTVKPPSNPEEAFKNRVRQWLQQRIDVIGQYPAARQELSRRWAELEIPTLKASQGHSPEQLGQIASLLSTLEKMWELPFPPEHPRKEDENNTTQQILSMFPGTSVTDNTNSDTPNP